MVANDIADYKRAWLSRYSEPIKVRFPRNCRRQHRRSLAGTVQCTKLDDPCRLPTKSPITGWCCCLGGVARYSAARTVHRSTFASRGMVANDIADYKLAWLSRYSAPIKVRFPRNCRQQHRRSLADTVQCTDQRSVTEERMPTTSPSTSWRGCLDQRMALSV